ncbi:MAG: flagellar hook-length control protein FliK [Phenylobacterium sp.]|uniref:flagellar hook-length control protein FliK n=1 Tax=Phenylobacterium sp. TaxID=1871053 RepID=UPI0039194D43
MTAPLLNLQFAAPASPGTNALGAAPEGEAAGGFEALMAALLDGETPADDAAPSTEEPASSAEPTGDTLPAVDTAAIAAAFVPPPPPGAAGVEPEGETAEPTDAVPAEGHAEAKARPQPPGSEIAALASGRTAPPKGETDDVEAEPSAAKPTPPGLEKPREAQLTPAAEHAQARGNPPAHAAAAQSPAPAPTAPTAPPAEAAPEPDAPVQDDAPATSTPSLEADAEAETASPDLRARVAGSAGEEPRAQRPAASPTPAAPPAAQAGVNPSPRAADPAKAAEPTAKPEAVTAAAPKAESEPVAEKSETASATAGAAGPSHRAAAPAHEPPAPVRGSPETVANLAAQIVKKLEARTTRFDVQLRPAGLGQVNVAVEIGAHGRLVAALTFDNSHAAAELRGRSGDLQRALEQAGFDLSNGSLTFDVAGDRGQGRGDMHQQFHDGASRGRAFHALLDTAGEAAEAAATAALAYRSRPADGVDIRV